MKTRPKIWIEILAFSTAGALVVALLLVSLGAAAGAASGGSEQPQPVAPPNSQLSSSQMPLGPQQTYDGMVTCSRCGAKHPATSSRNASDCTRSCVHAGASFALIDGDVVYLLKGNLDQVKKVAGQRATITGSINGQTIEVSSVSAGT
ncbi:MAG: hypothetical protein WB729_23635 [Candidatus Sulfotelmatobacter sp.]